MAQGWLQLAVFVALVIARHPSARRLHGPGVSKRASLPDAGRRPGRAPHLPGAPGQSGTGPGLEGLRPQPDRLLALLLAGALRDPAHPGDPAVQPGRVRLGPVGRQLQHRLVVRLQHQLAVLRGRDDAQLLLPDGGADGPELRHPGRRHVRAGGADPRDHRPQRRGAGELLAGPGPKPLLHPPAAVDRRRPDPRLAGRAADPRRRGHRHHARGRQPDPGARPRRPPRSRSSSWAPTAAASSTSTRRCRSRTRPSSPTSSRLSR